MARLHERYVRPALQRAPLRQPMDTDSEYLIYRSLLGTPSAGAGRRLRHGTGGAAGWRASRPRWWRQDVSSVMLEEGVAQVREAGATVILLQRRRPICRPRRRSRRGSYGRLSLHYVEDLGWLMLEAGGSSPGLPVASTYAPPGSGVLTCTAK